MKPVIKFVITDVSMGNGHDGLNAILAQHKKKNPLFARSIAEGGLVLFINRARSKCKLMGENSAIMGYCRMPGHGRLTQQAIDLIPATFGLHHLATSELPRVPGEKDRAKEKGVSGAGSSDQGASVRLISGETNEN